MLKSHRVAGGNIETVYNVLITMLAGKSVRLSMDESTSSVVALATADIQADIAKTVAQLQASDVLFEVIQLKTIDPYFAIGLLEQMLDPPKQSGRAPTSIVLERRNAGRRFDDRRRDNRDRGRDDRRRDEWRRRGLSEMPTKFAGPKVPPPKIDADPSTRRLFVRATKHQLEQIKKIIAQVDGQPTTAGNGNIRILPLTGKRAEQLLVTAAKFWRDANPVILYPSSYKPNQVNERAINGDSTNKKPNAKKPDLNSAARYLTDNIRSQAAAIRCRLTHRGMLLQCSDTKALDRFEKTLRTIAGPAESPRSPPTVFYLKYSKPAGALRMLAELLDGGELSRGGEVGSLVNGNVIRGSFLGSIVTSRDGTMTMTADTITVVADPRLNRLIAQGTVDDIERIEGYLKIVDKDISITSVETYGKPHVISLSHTKAAIVAATIRDAFANRLSGGTQRSNAKTNQPGAKQKPKRENESNEREGEAKKSQGKKPAAKPSSNKRGQDLEPRMTIAIHQPSNSLIVTAPDQLFKQVEQLVKQIDVSNQRSIAIMLSGPPTVQATLQQLFSKGNVTGRGTAGNSSRAGSPSRTPARSQGTTRSRSRPRTPGTNRRGRRDR